MTTKKTKTMVLDTNVLLSDTNAITSFDDNVVVIPIAVIEELDKQKSRQDEVGANARIVSRKLDELRLSGSLFEGVKLPGGGILKVVTIDDAAMKLLPVELRTPKVDNFLIAYMLQVKKTNRNAVLVSRDINVRLKCDALAIKCEDYLKIRITNDSSDFYTGVTVIETSESVVGTFYSNAVVEKASETLGTKLYPNQIVVLKSKNVNKITSTSALTKHVDNTLIPLKKFDEVYGLKPRNKEQNFALDLLFDDKIKLVTIASQAGCGKTLISLAAGLAQLKNLGDDPKYSKLIVTRPIIPVGRDIGFLPGTLSEKMEPWISPIRDNLNFLMGDKKPKSHKESGFENRRYGTYLDILQEKGLIEIEAITFIRGRSIQNAFMLIDECQNLSVHELKTIITRAGEDTKIVLLGDLNQIDHTHVDMYTNGLTYAIEKFKHHKIAGHITLLRGERSELATVAAEIL